MCLNISNINIKGEEQNPLLELVRNKEDPLEELHKIHAQEITFLDARNHPQIQADHARNLNLFSAKTRRIKK